jgi:hypothetical protein
MRIATGRFTKTTASPPPICFVIQPFDNGMFHKRYDDIFAPAIRAAGIEPYRVDRDHSTVIPIDDIEAGIRRSLLCFADISLDNPNVWYELGFALAAGKHIEMVCSHTREKFPFDVQHRFITRYKTEAPSDFTDLEAKITNRLKVAIQRIQEASQRHAANGPSQLRQPLSALASELLSNAIADEGRLFAFAFESAETPRQRADLRAALEELSNADFVTATQDIDVFDITPPGFLHYEANKAKPDDAQSATRKVTLYDGPQKLDQRLR